MAITVPQEVLLRARRNAPLDQQTRPRFGSFAWRSQNIVGSSSIQQTSPPLDFFGSINILPDPNQLSQITINNWTYTENPAGSGSVTFYPLTNPGIYGPIAVADGLYIPNYLYYDMGAGGGIFVGYINKPECPLSGWFVNYDSAIPLLYTSATNASPTNIPNTEWFKAAECRPGDTIVTNISSFSLPFVPYLFNRINTNAYFNITSSDYVFDTNTYEFYTTNNSLVFNSLTALELIQFDGTAGTKVKMDLTNFSNLARIYNFLGMINLTDFSLPINDKLEYFSSAIFPKLTSFRYKPNHIYPRLRDAWFSNINVNQLNPPLSESSNFYDNIITSVYSAISSSQLSAWRITYPTSQLPPHSNPSGQALGRSSSSDDVFLKLIATNPFGAPFELDSYFPIEYLPTGTYYPHTLGNTLVVQSPASAQGSAFVRFNALSGIYTKTGDIKDNRDVFRNSNDYFVLFDEPLQRWTVVGPLSTSTAVWLSAQETIGDYGNIPKRGWGGPAFRRFASLGGAWSVDTCVYSTQTLVFSGTRVINGRYGYDPYQGFNNDSCWKDLDFSGIGYQNVSDPEWNSKITLVSPVHFINTSHFPSTMPEGTVFKFIHKDGSVSTRSVLSSIDIQPSATDIRIGILNEPVSAACYSIGDYFGFCRTLSAKSDYTRMLLGPTSTGEVSQTIPSFVANKLVYGGAPSNYFKYSSLPKSRWYSSANMVGGESSTGMWVRQRNNQLSIMGLVKYADFSSENALSPYYNSMFNAATSLCNRFYTDPFAYTLTAANFN